MTEGDFTELLFDEIINCEKVPKWIKYLLTALLCGFIFTLGAVMVFSAEAVLGRLLSAAVALFAAWAFISLCLRIHRM